jgi:nucleoid-associated protein YgaU
MVRRRRSGRAFWLFLVLLAVAGGWVANQGWRWPLLALFDRPSEPEAQVAAPDTVAEHPPREQPAVEQPLVEGLVPEETPSGQTAARQGDARPPAAAAKGPSDTVAADETPAAGPIEEPVAPERETAQQPEVGPVVSEPAEPVPEPAERDVAAIEPDQTPAPQVTPETEGASKPPRELPEQESDSPASAEGEVEQAAVAPAAAPPAGAPTVVRPSFDIVRIEPDGRAVIAGRAAPGAEVEVRSGTQVIDRVRASRRGEWVAIPGKPLAPGDQQLTAVAAREGAPPVESEQAVVVAVPGPGSPAPATASEPAQPKVSTPAQAVAVLVPRDGKGTGRILQAPGRLSAEGTLALMTVSYDEAGKIQLSGEAPPGVPVRIYVDNRPAAVVVGDAKGAWSSGLDQALEPGTYTLRLDQLDPQGQPVARIETPFTRVAQPPVAGEIQVDYVVVQPGNSLWRIARRLSGKGLDYVYIYDANQGQIRDPDLIYPGQVFEIPADFGSAG